MSYILDALRKADAERERGAVPGLHAQTAATPSQETNTSGLNRKLIWAVGILSVIVAGLLAWTLGGHEGPPDHQQPGMQGADAKGGPPPGLPPGAHPGDRPDVSVSAPPQRPPVDLPSPTLPATTSVQGPAGTYPPQPAPMPPAVQATARLMEPPGATKPATAVQQTPAKTAATGATSSNAAANADNRIYQVNELPDSVRREVPTITVGGAMYSDTPASRMLIVNGQIFHEGDKLTGELTLEEIRLKSAILRFRSYRYAINY